MAKHTITQRTARTVALMISAQTEIRQSADFLGEGLRAIEQYAGELSTENLHDTSIGVQAEGVRLAMAGQALRAASERLAIALLLAADAGAK
ncbi:MAG: hypothetical protein ABI548_07370 [Polyangiaceae bacterium]